MSLKIIFMGTPAFAVPTLESLIKSTHEVIAVYSQPPRPAGRGHKIQKSPTHQIAEQNNIKIFIPKSLKKPEIQKEFTSLKADIAVVAAYGLILPKEILTACKYGCINIHPSLLPRWRGSAPIQRAIMAGDKKTGIDIMQMDAGLDTGDILIEEQVDINKDTTTGELHDLLSEKGAELVLKTLGKIENGFAKSTPQNSKGATYAAKITKKDQHIKWDKEARLVNALIHGLSPRPGAFFYFEDKAIKISSSDFSNIETKEKPGTVLNDKLDIACRDGVLHPKIVQYPGKKAMDIDRFLRGYSIPAGTILK